MAKLNIIKDIRGDKVTKKRRRRLTSARACRQYLGDIVYRLDTGALDATIGGKMIYGISIILRSLELDELEKRVDALEQAKERTA
jgi:hypothetical protein